MTHPGQREEFLRKAAQAEMEEVKAAEEQARRAWERIVVGYLELAELAARTELSLS